MLQAEFGKDRTQSSTCCPNKQIDLEGGICLVMSYLQSNCIIRCFFYSMSTPCSSWAPRSLPPCSPIPAMTPEIMSCFCSPPQTSHPCHEISCTLRKLAPGESNQEPLSGEGEGSQKEILEVNLVLCREARQIHRMAHPGYHVYSFI